MRRTIVGAAMLMVFAVLPTAELSAQLFTRDSRPGNDVLSFNVFGGGLFSANTLGGGTEFDDAGSAGGTATLWVHRNVGVRANLLWSAPSVLWVDANPLAGEDPNVWHYSGDVVLRMPLTATARMSWFPYIVGGMGGKTYDFETLSTATDFAGNIGAGVEVRFGEYGRYGINTEVRDYLSNFERAGFDRTLNDVTWTGGITLNF